MILKKSWLSDPEILGICEQVSCKEYAQEELFSQIETENTENKITTESSTTTSILTPEDRRNVELIKKTMTER